MTRTAKTLLAIAAMTTGLGAYGCNKNPSELHNEAVEAQREADKTASESIAEANKKAAEADEQAREKMAKAQANANDKIREANRELGEERGELKGWADKKLDEVNSLIDDAKVKAQTAAPKVRGNFNQAIQEVETRRDALKSDLASLGARADNTQDKVKDAISGRIDQLKDRIHEIERTL